MRDDIPPELVAVVTKMTAKDPDERFQTPAEVAEALKSFSRSVEPRKGVEPPTQAKPRGWKPTFLSLTAIAALFVAALFAGLIYYVQTDYGVVRVEVTDPSLEVTIKDHTITMKDGDGKPLTIRPGEQTLIVRKDDADFEFETESFQIRRGEKIAFKVEMLPGEIVVTKDNKWFSGADGIVGSVSGSKLELSADLAKNFIRSREHRDNFEEELCKAISYAAGIPNEQWEQFASTANASIDAIQGTPLTWFIVKQPSLAGETRMLTDRPAPMRDVHRAMSPSQSNGYVSLIQPEYIKNIKLDINKEKNQLQGTLDFEAPKLYAGKVDFDLQMDAGRMKVVEFRFPRDGISVSLDENGVWQLLSQDLTLLQGEWDVVAFTQDGRKELAADKGVGMQLRIKGNTLSRSQTRPDGKKSERPWGSIELDSTANPKSIDIVNPDGPGGRLLGIYELKDGALRICFAERSNVDDAQSIPVKRPRTFDAPAGSRNVLLECRRVDADPDLKQLRSDSVNEVDLGLLQGDWETVSLTESGKQLAAQDGFSGLLLQIKGDTFVIAERKPNGEKSEVDTGRIEVNSTATPKTIDFIGRDERRLGIYELKHGVLRVCLVEHGGIEGSRGERISEGNPFNRPTTFKSAAGSNMMLMEFRRKSDNALQTTEDARSLPLVQVLHDAEGLTAKRVKIIGTFLVTDDKFGVRSYKISTADEDLPPPSIGDAYSEREVTFAASFDEEKIINVGQFHNKRVLATGAIYYFPADPEGPAEVIFMMDGINEYWQGEESKADSGDAANRSSLQNIRSVPTQGRTDLGGNGVYFAKAQLSKDAKTALVESGAILQMWNLETEQLSSISEWGGQGGVVGFVPESNLAWHAQHGVEFWDMGQSTRTGLKIPHLSGPSESTPIPPAFSENGKLLVTQTDVGKFRFWNLETQKPLSPVIEAGTLLLGMTFSPDGKWFFTEDKSGWTVWNVATQKRVAGPLKNDISDRNAAISVSPDSSSIATIEGQLPECEIVIRVAQGETWKALKRIPVRHSVVQAVWVDSQHLAIVFRYGDVEFGLKVISIDGRQLQDYGYLRTFDKIKIAPDRQHLVVSSYAAATCWKLGRKEHLWKIGTSASGRSYDVHFGKDWVLLHEKGATTGPRPAIVRSLNNGNEVFRKEDVIATAVNGANICLVDAKGIEVWRSQEFSDGDRLQNSIPEVSENPTDPISVIRKAVLPQNFDAEGAGWKRFSVESVGARGGTASGVPENLRPLLAKLPQPKLSLRKLADEVEAERQAAPTVESGCGLAGLPGSRTRRAQSVRSSYSSKSSLKKSTRSLPKQRGSSAWPWKAKDRSSTRS